MGRDLKVLIITGRGATHTSIQYELFNNAFLDGKCRKYELAGVNMNHKLLEYDEIYCFGDCSKEPVYIMAEELGCDIWQMG